MKKFMVFAVAAFVLSGCVGKDQRAVMLQLMVEEAHNVKNNPRLFCAISGFEIIVPAGRSNWEKPVEINVAPAIWDLEAKLTKNRVYPIYGLSDELISFADTLDGYLRAKCGRMSPHHPQTLKNIADGEKLLAEIGPVGSNLPKHLRPVDVDL